MDFARCSYYMCSMMKIISSRDGSEQELTSLQEENITADWKCPFCSKICTCALCRKKRPNPDKIVREKDGRAVVRSSRLQEKRRTETQQKAKYGAKGKGKKRKAEGESDGRVAKRKRFSDDEESCDGGPISFDEQENISEEDGFEVEASPKGMGNKKVKGTLSGRSNGNKPQNLSRFFTTAKTQASALELKTEPPGIFPKTVPDSLFLIGVLANQAREFLKDNNLLTPVINISLDTIQLCNDNVIASLCLEGISSSDFGHDLTFFVDEQLSQSQEEKGNDAQQDTPIMANIV